MITRRLPRASSALSRSSWTCPACTRASILPLALSQPQQRRRLHHVPPLTYDETFKESGVPGLFSPTGYKLGWTTYQQMMVQKLNELIAGEPIENSTAKTLALQFARDPMSASIFNHASMAHNNHFFFSTLSTSPLPLSRVPNLEKSLVDAFGSIDTLQATMLDTAAAMFGPGFVWLVWARNVDGGGATRRGGWRILTTYLAGTPYAEAGYRQQGVDMNNQNPSSYNAYLSQQQQPTNVVGTFGAYSQGGRDQAKLPPGGTSVLPVLCVNTWEHVYIYDFGLGGKRRYLSQWWDAVDWSVVEGNAPTEAKNLMEFQSR